jgi:opacity protein-like surface antigen
MKRLAACVLVLALTAGPASAVTIGGGAFGGLSIPVAQDDNGQGTIFGIRAPVGFAPMFTVEPYASWTTGGEAEQTVAGIELTRSGIDLTSYGANVLLTFGTGVQFFPFAGIGSTASERDGLDQSSTSYNFGLGIGFKPFAMPLAIDVRGEYFSVTDENNTDIGRNWGNVTLGATYMIFSK